MSDNISSNERNNTNKRAIRKVSRANTKGQSAKRLSRNAKIGIIVAVLCLVAIGLGLGIGIPLSSQKETTEEKVYFNEPYELENGKKVEFEKENYQTLLRYIDNDKVRHMFVFAYDSNVFYADEEDEDTYNKDYTELIRRVANFQNDVNEAKAKGINVELYIVDVRVDSSINADLLKDDSHFGGFYTDSEVTDYPPAFIYVYEGEFKDKMDGYDVVSTSSFNELFSVINNAGNYLDHLTE